MIEKIALWLKAASTAVDNALRAAVAAYPTLMLILFLAAGLAVGVMLSRWAAIAEEEDAKRERGKIRRRGRRYSAKKWGEPLPPDWWENKPWWRQK